jgi:hypothetical protein
MGQWLRMLAVVGLGLLSGCVHRVRIESQPSGAELFVDGKSVGVTPATFEDPDSQSEPHVYHLSFRQKGLPPWRSEVAQSASTDADSHTRLAVALGVTSVVVLAGIGLAFVNPPAAAALLSIGAGGGGICGLGGGLCKVATESPPGARRDAPYRLSDDSYSFDLTTRTRSNPETAAIQTMTLEQDISQRLEVGRGDFTRLEIVEGVLVVSLGAEASLEPGSAQEARLQYLTQEWTLALTRDRCRKGPPDQERSCLQTEAQAPVKVRTIGVDGVVRGEPDNGIPVFIPPPLPAPLPIDPPKEPVTPPQDVPAAP